MKKLIAALCLVALAVPMFALNAPRTNAANAKAQLDQIVQNAKAYPDRGRQEEFVAQNLEAMAQEMQTLSLEEALPLARVYASYRLFGTSLVNFCKEVNTVDDRLNKTLAEFASRIERLAK
jgi:hypothetical protein